MSVSIYMAVGADLATVLPICKPQCAIRITASYSYDIHYMYKDTVWLYWQEYSELIICRINDVLPVPWSPQNNTLISWFSKAS